MCTEEISWSECFYSDVFEDQYAKFRKYEDYGYTRIFSGLNPLIGFAKFFVKVYVNKNKIASLEVEGQL